MKGAQFKGPLREVEKIIADYKWSCLKEKARCMDYDFYKKYEPNNVEMLNKLRSEIRLLEKRNLKTRNCLELLNENEFELIDQVYYKHKYYKHIPNLADLISSKMNDKNLMVAASKFKKRVLEKLLLEHILDNDY